MKIRTATMDDLSAVTQLEKACFPQAEAASEASFASRLSVYPGHFWLLMDGEALVSMVNGMTTNQPDLQDAMYENAALHEESGEWQMIFGVDTHPDYRRRGCAGRLLEHVIAQAKAQGRKGLVLTCKDALVSYYSRFGFVSEGLSSSTHGDAAWYQMRLTFSYDSYD